MADKTIIRHPSTLSRHISLAKTFFHPPERVGTLGYASLPTLSGRWKKVSLAIYICIVWKGVIYLVYINYQFHWIERDTIKIGRSTLRERGWTLASL